MKTYSAKPGDVEKRWYVVDAEGQTLGRLATRVATVLRGKHKPHFTPHLDVGDFVIVVNAEKVRLTGDKLNSKWERRHSGYPGGLKSLWYEQLLSKHPERAIRKAVWGMLPKGSLGRRQLRKLKVYAGPDHPHRSQKPAPLTVDEVHAVAGAASLRPPATPEEKAAARPKRRPKPERPRRKKAEEKPAAAEPKRRSRRKAGAPAEETKPAEEPEAAEQPAAEAEDEAPEAEQKAESPEAEVATEEAGEPEQTEAGPAEDAEGSETKEDGA